MTDRNSSFPTYELDLPFEHTVIGYVYGFTGTFVAVERNDRHHPFAVYEVGVPVSASELGLRPCFHGCYFELRSDAMAMLFERARLCGVAA